VHATDATPNRYRHARPLAQSLSRHPQAYLDNIHRQINNLLGQASSRSQSHHWPVLVKRAESNTPPRCTIDYRGSNITYNDAYSLPNIGVCSDTLESCSYFSTLDLRSVLLFRHVSLHPADADKTAFITRREQLRSKVLSMGLCNAPSCFQRLLDLVLNRLTWSCCLEYVDDVIIKSK